MGKNNFFKIIYTSLPPFFLLLNINLYKTIEICDHYPNFAATRKFKSEAHEFWSNYRDLSNVEYSSMTQQLLRSVSTRMCNFIKEVVSRPKFRRRRGGGGEKEEV